METFIIKFIFTKNVRIHLHLLTWFILPQWRDDHSKGTKKKYVAGKIPVSANSEGSEEWADTAFLRQYETGLIVQWLCFTFACTYMKTNKDVAGIYPANYKWEFESPTEWRDRYDSLCATDYFS